MAASPKKLIQYTRRPFQITLTSADVDLTTVTSVDLYVHRDVEGVNTVTETWAATIASATATELDATYAPTASGAGSVTVANEVLQIRALANFSGSPTIECEIEFYRVEER